MRALTIVTHPECGPLDCVRFSLADRLRHTGEGIQMSEDSCEEPAASDIPATQVITGLSPVTSSDDFEIVAAVREGGADPATSPQPGAKHELASRAHLTQHIAKPRPAQEDNAAADKQVPGEEEVVTECVGKSSREAATTE